MPTLDARRTYADGQILFGADLDAIVDDIEAILNTTKLNDDNLQDQGITASTKLVDTSITAGKLGPSSVTTTKIMDANVTTAKLVDESVTRAKIEAVERIPVGVVMPFAGTAAPSGWLLIDGTAVSRSTYAALFAVIGTTYGVGNGTTTFNLPPTMGRATIGAGSGSLTTRALGATGGAETHTLASSEMPSHTHTQVAHTHATAIGTFTGGSSGGAVDATKIAGAQPSASPQLGTNTLSVPNATPAINNTGGGGSHNNMQPFLALNHIIKY